MKKGLVIINTGDGKGKTTAALGMALRTIGNGKKLCIIQFIKSSRLNCGEHKALERLGAEIIKGGVGFTDKTNESESREALKAVFEVASDKIINGNYDMVILDEIIYALNIFDFDISDIISEDKVIDILRNRPDGMHVVLTGRKASENLINFADMVTEMKEIKHHFKSGVKAQVCIEF